MLLQKLKILLAILPILLIGACASVPPPPPVVYKDPLSRLHTIQAETIAENARVRVTEPVALVISENTEAYIAHVKGAQAHMGSYLLPNTHAMGEMDPKFLVDHWVTQIRKRYPALDLADDLNAARKSGKQTVIVLDVQVAFGARSGDSTSVQLTGLFFDSAMNPASRIIGRGSAVIPYPAWDTGFQAAATKALQEFEQKMQSVTQ